MQATEDQLQTMINSLPVMAWSCCANGLFEFVNQRWLDYSGLPIKASTGYGWLRAIHEEDSSRTLQMWQALIKLGKSDHIETRIRRNDGLYRWFLLQAEPLLDDSGRILRWYGTNTDIHDLKQAQAKLSQDERELRQMTDAIPHLINVLSPAGGFIYANQALMTYTGFTLADVKAEDFRAKMFHPDDFERVFNEREYALARTNPFELEIRLRESTASIAGFSFAITPCKMRRVGYCVGMLRAPTSMTESGHKNAYKTRTSFYGKRSSGAPCSRRSSEPPMCCARFCIRSQRLRRLTLQC